MIKSGNIKPVSVWWQSSTGLGLSSATRRALAPWVRQLNARNILQIGMPNLWKHRELPCKANWFLSDSYWPILHGPSFSTPLVAARPEQLPFCADAFDLVILPYILELSDDPKQVLTECYRVLQPEGHLLLLSFNPHSLFNLMRGYKLLRKDPSWPWYKPFMPVNAVKRLLTEQDFEVKQGRYFQYRLPLLPRRWQSRRQWLEFAGDRWWPTGANGYMLLAQRREPGWVMTAPAWTLYAPATHQVGAMRSRLLRHTRDME